MPGEASLESLPTGGWFYGRGDLTVIDAMLGVLTGIRRRGALVMLIEMTGTDAASGRAMAEALQLDTRQPLLVGSVGLPLTAVDTLAEDFLRAPTDDARRRLAKRLGALDPPLFGYARLVVPLSRRDPSKLLAMAENLLRGKAVRCAETSKCKHFEEAPEQLLIGRDGVLAAYLVDTTLTIDLLTASYDEPGSDEVLSALAAFHSNRGGPGQTAGGRPRCSRVAEAAGSSFCLVPARAADAGVATGLMNVLGAVSTPSIDFQQAVAIAKLGTTEAHQSRKILERLPQALDDGTFTFTKTAEGLELSGSWLASAASEEQIARTLGSEQCADGSASVVALLDKLRNAFGVASGTDPKVWEQMQEAGWGAYPVIAGAAWPTYIPWLQELAKSSPSPFDGRTCAVLKDGRLDMTVTLVSGRALVK